MDDHVHGLINKLGTIGVVSFRPVIASAGVARDIVVWTEKTTCGAAADGFDGAWFQVNEDRSGDVFAVIDLLID